MKFMSSKLKEVNVVVTVSGEDEKVRRTTALEIKKAIQKMNRLNKHKDPSNEGISFEISF